jgi:PTH1 family peptidyl-tRNA hydrolase
MRALIGLGNPGEKYAKTRHNLGFQCVDAVAKELELTGWKKFQGGEILSGEGIHLFKPSSFMNNSGQAVRQLLDYYNLDSPDLCIAADDVYLAPGSARVRQSGGDGGHNGWKSVLEHLDLDTFWRIKIGAGIYEQHPDKRKHMAGLEDYVLQRMPKHEEKLTEELIDKMVPNLVQWLKHGTGLTEETVHN